jgi:hypothetical protein
MRAVKPGFHLVRGRWKSSFTTLVGVEMGGLVGGTEGGIPAPFGIN